MIIRLRLCRRCSFQAPPQAAFDVKYGGSVEIRFKHRRNSMRFSRLLLSVLGIALLIGVLNSVSVKATPPQQGPTLLTLQRVGTSSFASAPMATDVSGVPDETDAALNGDDADSNNGSGVGIAINRSLPGTSSGKGASVSSKHKSNPVLGTHFQGLNYHDQRTANGGNQFSVEPPDQGLCAGNGFVMETVNDVLRVYSTAGTPVTGVIDANTFYGYPAQFNRATRKQGPFVTDPSCYFDAATQRWFHVSLTLEVNPDTGALLGPNHLDLAVSAGSNPTTGTWTIYRLPVQDDGTAGTPNHGCSLGPCIGDYPHIGADANGFYITTNEYSLFGPEFKAAQIYAFSKAALARHDTNLTVVQFDTRDTQAAGRAGFTV